MKNLAEFFRLAELRYTIKLRREANPTLPAPWVDDPIFKEWRFCNVFREDDRTTKWFRTHVRDPLRGTDRVLWATVAFRWFNRIETGQKILEPLLEQEPYAHAVEEFRTKLRGVAPVVTGAYMIKTPDGLNKLDGVLKCITDFEHLNNSLVRQCRASMSETRSLEGIHAILKGSPFLGSFMAYEVVSDLRWTWWCEGASDINTWAAAGPGCARGIGWTVDGNHEKWNYNSAKDQVELLAAMRQILAASRDPAYWPFVDRPWEMREVEHWACEVWKYVRCRDMGQRLKQRYTPFAP